jgi:hypothetical protein
MLMLIAIRLKLSPVRALARPDLRLWSYCSEHQASTGSAHAVSIALPDTVDTVGEGQVDATRGSGAAPVVAAQPQPLLAQKVGLLLLFIFGLAHDSLGTAACRRWSASVPFLVVGANVAHLALETYQTTSLQMPTYCLSVVTCVSGSVLYVGMVYYERRHLPRVLGLLAAAGARADSATAAGSQLLALPARLTFAVIVAGAAAATAFSIVHASSLAEASAWTYPLVGARAYVVVTASLLAFALWTRACAVMIEAASGVEAQFVNMGRQPSSAASSSYPSGNGIPTVDFQASPCHRVAPAGLQRAKHDDCTGSLFDTAEPSLFANASGTTPRVAGTALGCPSPMLPRAAARQGRDVAEHEPSHMRSVRRLRDAVDAAGDGSPWSQHTMASKLSAAGLLGSRRVHPDHVAVSVSGAAAKLRPGVASGRPLKYRADSLCPRTPIAPLTTPPPTLITAPEDRDEWPSSESDVPRTQFTPTTRRAATLPALARRVHDARMRQLDKQCREAVVRLQCLRAALWEMSVGIRVWYCAVVLCTAGGGAAAALLALKQHDITLLASSCAVFTLLLAFVFISTRVSEACANILLAVARSPSAALMVAVHRNSALLAMMQASSNQADCLMVYGARVQLAGLAKVASVTASVLAVAATQLQ